MSMQHGGCYRHLSFAENSGSRVPVIGSRLPHSQRQPVHFAVTNAAKVGQEGSFSRCSFGRRRRLYVVLVVIKCVLDVYVSQLIEESV